MQGKEKHLFEKSFIDASWNDLSSQLDAQLPVQEAPRRDKTPIILLLALLAISIGVASFYAYKYKSFVPQAALTKEKTTSKTIYQYIENPSATVSERINASTTLTTRETINNTKNTVAPNSSNYDQREIESASTVDLISPETITTPQALENKQQLLLSESNNTIQTNANLSEDTPENKRKINFNIGLLTSATTDMDYTGYGLASNFVFPVGKRLGINAGVGINVLSKDHYFVSYIPRENITDIKTNANGIIDLRSLKQIYLPVSLSYEVLPGFAVNSGMRIRYTYQEETENIIPIPTRGLPTEPSASFLQRTNLGLSAGISYDLSKNTSLLLDSEWGFNSLLNQSLFTDPEGLNYDINLINLTTSIKF